MVCFTRGHCRLRSRGRTIDDDKPKRGPADWRFLSDIRRAGAESGVSVGAWAGASAATIPDDRHPVPESLIEAAVLLVGSDPNEDLRLVRRTIDDDKPKRGPADWRFLSDIRLAGAGNGVSVGTWAGASAATSPDDRHPVPEGLIEAVVLLVGSVPNEDVGHVLREARCVPAGKSCVPAGQSMVASVGAATAYQSSYITDKNCNDGGIRSVPNLSLPSFGLG